MKLVLTLSALGLVAASMAQAATLDELDANGDGAVTMDEVQAIYPEIAAETFNAADSNADGVLDEEGLVLAQQAGLMPMSDG